MTRVDETRVDVAPLRAVFLDVDETLLDTTTAGTAALQDVLGPNADWGLWCDMTETHYPRFVSGELDFPAMMVARMAGYLEVVGADPTAAAELEHARDESLVRRSLVFDDVPGALDDLRRRGVVTGLITNSEPVHQRAKLAAAGLSGTTDVEVISGEVGVGKPDPAVFTLACAQAGVDPAAAVHVGDRLETDAIAAAAAGLTGVWLARPTLADPDKVAAVRAAGTVPVITSLTQLADLLDRRFTGQGCLARPTGSGRV